MLSVRKRFGLAATLKAIPVSAIVVLFIGSPYAASAEPQRFSPAALQADLRFAIETIESQHPDIAHSVKRARLDNVAQRVQNELVRPMDQTEAWATLAQLNPVMADGHLFIGLPDWRGQSAEAIRNGIGLFPFEISLDARQYPVIVAALGGSETPFAGRRITAINGTDARRVARALLARTHGDAPAFRKALLSQRWWLSFWKLHGAPSDFDIVMDGIREPQSFQASHSLPEILQQEASFERMFACRIDADGSARLTVATFYWEDKDRFFTFTHDCFTRMKAASTKRLLIDVSANGGGDDDMWKDGILRYIATQPYKQGSTYVKRERSGAVTAGAIETATKAATDEPLQFTGELTVLIGPLTYSSAVLFSNVVRDYGFGSLVGTGGAARTRQSGGVQSVRLPNTGLVLSYPRFVLDPPSGRGASQYLEPAKQMRFSDLAELGW